MSGEITYTSQLAVDNGAYVDSFNAGIINQTTDQTNPNGVKMSFLVPTTIELIPLGSIVRVGLFAITNNDPVNSVTIYSAISGGVAMFIVGPGQTQGPVYLAPTAPAWQASNAAVEVFFMALDT
jgi:hypothetical protein